MSITQEEFEKLTRDDLEKLKFVLDSNWNVCVRWFWVKWDDWNDWKTILNWSVDPTTEWVDGDFYINTTSWQIFWPKATVWGTWTDLIWADWTNGTNWVNWNWISSIVLLSWDHSPWTLDTYRITYTDTTTFDFQVYNWADWSWSLVSVVWWTNISIDNTNPNNPVVNFWLWTNENFVTDTEKTAIWTIWWKENVANKWQANWYAPLWADSKISSTYLPSYVDDVIEVANYASLPVTWETWKIYITLDTNFEYRWSWSVYVEIKDSWETEQSLGVLINNATEKTTPVDTDMVWLMDSAWSNILKKVSWANIKATLKTYFDSLTTTLTNKTISLTNNTISWTKSEFDTACNNWNFVFTDWNQTIDWVKTFSSSPIVPTPTTDMEVATKKYVDDNAWWWASTQSTFTAWEDILIWNAFCLPWNIPIWSFTNLEDISTLASNKRKSIQIIWSWISSNTIWFYIKKTWTLATNFWVRIETDNNGVPSWTLADINATTNIWFWTITTSLSEINATFPWSFTLTNLVKYHIVVFNGTYGSETLSTANYYSLGYVTYLNKKINTYWLFAYWSWNNQNITTFTGNRIAGNLWFRILATRNIAIKSVTKADLANGTTVTIKTDAWVTIWTATAVSNIATFTNPIVLENGLYYRVLLATWNYSREVYMQASFPMVKNWFTIISWAEDTTNSAYYGWNIEAIETQEVQEDNIASNKNIYLNSNFLNKNLLYKANASYLETSNVIWISTETKLALNTFIWDISWINQNQTFLTTDFWKDLYLTNTDWIIWVTPWTNIVKVWKIINNTSFEINIDQVKQLWVITPTVWASPYTYQNTTWRPVLVSITWGTVSQVAYSRDNTNYYQTSAATNTFVYLWINDYVKVTYSVIPTLKTFTF